MHKCGGQMQVVSFIEARQEEVIRRILEYCGLWQGPPSRLPPRLRPAGLAPRAGRSRTFASIPARSTHWTPRSKRTSRRSRQRRSLPRRVQLRTRRLSHSSNMTGLSSRVARRWSKTSCCSLPSAPISTLGRSEDSGCAR